MGDARVSLITLVRVQSLSPTPIDERQPPLPDFATAGAEQSPGRASDAQSCNAPQHSPRAYQYNVQRQCLDRSSFDGRPQSPARSPQLLPLVNWCANDAPSAAISRHNTSPLRLTLSPTATVDCSTHSPSLHNGDNVGSLDRQLLKARQRMIVDRYAQQQQQQQQRTQQSPDADAHVVEVRKPLESADLARSVHTRTTLVA